MAHNPPIPARLDFMDRLGMLALDENRDYVRQLNFNHMDSAATHSDAHTHTHTHFCLHC